MVTINGVIKKVIFYNPDNGYTVAAFSIDLKEKQNSLKGKYVSSKVTVVGIIDRSPFEDEKYKFEGDFIFDPKFGQQFKFTKYERETLDNRFGLISYLSSDLFKGIGIKKATEIVDGLGNNAIKLIKENPDCLNKFKLNNDQKSSIIQGILSDEMNRETTIFLLNLELSMDMIHKIIKAFNGIDVIKKVKENPYVLIDLVDRFGFKKADALGKKLGFSSVCNERLFALFRYTLNEVLNNTGNSYIHKTDFFIEVNKQVDEPLADNLFTYVLQKLVEANKFYIDENQNIFDYYFYKQEVALAKELALLLKDERNGNIGIKKYSSEKINSCFKKVIKESKIEFSEEQKLAIEKAFTEPVVIITGGPGTGKTTIVKAIIRMYLLLNGDNTLVTNTIALLAPTGRAAKRLKETTTLDAMTIHKFLGYDGAGHYEYDANNKTKEHLIIVDEASMMDLPLAARLITSMNEKARLIIVGDVDQLPSVGPGQVLKDLIDSKEIVTIYLKQIHRQAEGSTIINLAHNINEGVLPENLLEKQVDRVFIPSNPQNLPGMIVDLYKKVLEKVDSIRNVQILIPMYKGPSGINEINSVIQDIVNPLDNDKELKHLGRSFRVGDKVIQLINRTEKNIMNGDIGYVQGLIRKNETYVGLTVAFDNDVVSFEGDELEDLALAYAISIHKAQGSEFDNVIMPFTTQYYIMLKRKLIYTGVTRAKEKLLMIGDVQAMQLGIKYLEKERLTILKQCLIDFINGKEIIIKKNNLLKEKLKEIKISNNNLDLDNLGEEEFNLFGEN